MMRAMSVCSWLGIPRFRCARLPRARCCQGSKLAQVIVPLGKVITTLGYKLGWTSEACELIGPQGEVLPPDVEKGCPEVSEKVANKLIQQLDEQQVSRLDDATQSSVKAITRLKASWWSYLREYVRTGNREDACCVIDKASFLDFKDDVKKMITVVPKVSIWELMKELRVNRRSRKRLLRADTWILRWDPPAVERPKDAMKHLSYIGDMIYVNMNTMLVENEFIDVWKVIQWAVLSGKVGDCCGPRLSSYALEPRHRRTSSDQSALSSCPILCGQAADSW